MFKEFRKLAAEFGPWAATTLYLYAWAWRQRVSREETIYREWRRDPSTARPYSEFRAEMVEEGKLEERENE